MPAAWGEPCPPSVPNCPWPSWTPLPVGELQLHSPGPCTVCLMVSLPPQHREDCAPLQPADAEWAGRSTAVRLGGEAWGPRPAHPGARGSWGTEGRGGFQGRKASTAMSHLRPCYPPGLEGLSVCHHLSWPSRSPCRASSWALTPSNFLSCRKGPRQPDPPEVGREQFFCPLTSSEFWRCHGSLNVKAAGGIRPAQGGSKGPARFPALLPSLAVPTGQVVKQAVGGRGAARAGDPTSSGLWSLAPCHLLSTPQGHR